MPYITLTNGGRALVDHEHFSALNQYRWRRDADGYAVRGGGSGGHVLMHRAITNAVAGMEVDHRNGDRLDNRECNLRPCTRSQNQRNRCKRRGRHPYKGLRHRPSGRFQVTVLGRTIGTYTTAHEAAVAYNEAALAAFGEYARLNLVP